MQKVKGKVHATLTELKNMIGDVLAEVDEHGEVILTSYNKAKYRIEKIKPSQVDATEETEQSVKVESRQAVTEPPILMPPPTTHHEQHAEMVELAEAEADELIEEPVSHPAMIMPTPFATAPVEQLGETDGDAVTHSLTIEEVTEVMSESSPEPELAPVPAAAATPAADLFSLWSNLSEGELWHRDNSLELRWAQVARNLI